MNRILAVIAPLVIVASLPGLPGCAKSPPSGAESSVAADIAAEVAPGENCELWEVYLLQGKRIGYSHTTVRRVVEGGREMVRTEMLEHLTLQRQGQANTTEIRSASIESPEGQLNRFESAMRMGPSPIRTTGRVEGDRLEVEILGPGAATPKRTSIPWSPEVRGPFGVEQMLLRQPMQPGQRRQLKILMVGLDGVEVADVAMTARDFERTSFPSGARDLLRIETVMQLAGGQKIESIVWTDRTGDKLKNVMGGLEAYRASEAEALEKTDLAELDLSSSMLVKVDRPLPHAHQTEQVCYRVRLEGGDPASVFVTGPAQAVRSIDRQTAEITVYAIRPGRADGNPAAPADPPTDDDLCPNSFLQSDDPAILSDAQRAAGGETDPWRVAVALERFVHGEVRKKNFTQALATAAEVAQSREGDCTEHAVFLAALARARGVPARVAVGLVYMQAAEAFGYHMWTEVYVGERWIPLDGTLAQGGIGAGHLEIAHSSLKGVSASSAFLPVAQILGRLRIEIADAR